MKGVGRRDVLKGAMYGGVIWAQMPLGQGLRELHDVEGRPVQRVADPSTATAADKEHIVTVEAPPEARFNEPFKVTVALPNHPALGRHHISWLRLYVDNEPVCFMTFAPIWQRPEATFTLTLPKGARIDAVAECSTHGLWGGSAPIAVVQ